MLTDTALRNLKPKPKTYKAFDRDGMYVTVSPVGTVSGATCCRSGPTWSMPGSTGRPTCRS